MKRLLCVALCLVFGLPGLAAAARISKKPAARKPAAAKPAPPPPAEADEPELDDSLDRPLLDGGVETSEEETAPEPDQQEAAAGEATAPAEAAQAEPAPTRWHSERAYSWLETAVGPEALAILVEKGYLLAYRLGEARHLAHAQWALLEPLVARAPKLLEAQAAINGVRSGLSADGKEEALRAALELPASGVTTPRIRSAASILLDWSSERQAAGGLPLPERPFASQPWARDFVHRYNAREVRDPSPLVDPFFLEILLAPRMAAQAQAHLKAHVQSRYSSDVSEALDRDVKAGQMSDELRGWIIKYLDDNRRALRLLELPADFAALFKSNQLQKELAALRTVSDALSKDPGFISALRDWTSPGAEPPETVRVKLSGLHLHSPPHGDSFDPGDRATVSAAYWLDGVKKGETVAVQELVLADRGTQGVEALLTRERRLGSGGPYVLSVDAPVKDARPFVVKLRLHAAGSGPAHRDENVAPAQELEEATLLLARADSALEACSLKEAAGAYAKLTQSLFDRRGREPFDRLAAQVRPRVKRADGALEDWETLQGMLEAIRLDASPRECRFATDRGERARALLRRLPAGCSRDLAPEVNQLLAAAAQRRRDQDTFWSAVESGRRLERSCRHAQAASRFSAALAVLDADAAAKCGSAEAEHKTVKDRDLPGALAAERIRGEFQRQVEEAGKSLEAGDPAAALSGLNPLIAKIGAHPSAGCYDEERSKAEQLAARAGGALASPASALARLPDPVEETLGAVAREREKASAEAEAKRQRELSQQSPVSIEELPGVDAPPKGPAIPPAIESGEVSADEDEESLSDEEIATELGLIESEAEKPEPKKKPAAKSKAGTKSKSSKRRKS